jgi:hypothetical protein
MFCWTVNLYNLQYIKLEMRGNLKAFELINICLYCNACKWCGHNNNKQSSYNHNPCIWECVLELHPQALAIGAVNKVHLA